MFCQQCEETAGSGCETQGSCGKTDDLAALQDLLLEVTLSFGGALRERFIAGLAEEQEEVASWQLIEALAKTATSVDFAGDELLRLAIALAHGRDELLEELVLDDAGRERVARLTEVRPLASLGEALAQAEERLVARRRRVEADDGASIAELLVSGLKGLALHILRLRALGEDVAEARRFVMEAAAAVALDEEGPEVGLAHALRCGEMDLRVLERLRAVQQQRFGAPRPTSVRVGGRKGRAILVSGHDLAMLEALLEQTEGLGIDIYTHGEMLPAHAYPKLRAHPRLVGHYGGSWAQQGADFEAFPGPIVVTSNCLQKPRESYSHRLFLCPPLRWPGVKSIHRGEFGPVIEAVCAASGFLQDEAEEASQERVTGFGGDWLGEHHRAFASQLREREVPGILVVGGCDGHKRSREEYARLTEARQGWIVLTLGCLRYRLDDEDFLGERPRILDLGQCSDIGALVGLLQDIAADLSLDVRDLPIELHLSWYAQTAISALLALLHLGFEGIRLGPTAPAFLNRRVLRVLGQELDLQAGSVRLPMAV